MLLGSAHGKVTLDVSGLVAGAKTAESQLQRLAATGQKIGGALQGIGNSMTLGLTLPIVAAGGAAIKLASDLEETRNKVRVIFGDMSDEMLSWSDTANKSVGMTRASALDAASTFALFGQQAGLADEELVKFSKDQVQLAADFASFFNTRPEEAITAIGAAYRGESEPIRKYNILLNDQTVKQKAASMGLLDANGALSQQNRILAVNAVIMEQSGKAQGDFARTSDGLANQTRILNARFQDSLAMLGERLLPIALKVITALNSLLENFQKLPEPVQDAVLVLAGLVAILGPLLSMLGGVIGGVSSLAALFGTGGGLGAGVASLSPLVAGLVATLGSAGAALSGLAAASVPVLAMIAAILPGIGLLALAFATNFGGIRDTAERLWFILQWLFAKGMEGLIRAAQNSLRILQDRMRQSRDYIVATFTRLDWRQVGINIASGIASGLISGISKVIAAAKQVAEGALAAAKKALGIASDSKEFIKLGLYSGSGYVSGLKRMVTPGQIASVLTGPSRNISQQVSSQNIYNLASGLTLREARREMSRQVQANFNDLAFGLGGG